MSLPQKRGIAALSVVLEPHHRHPSPLTSKYRAINQSDTPTRSTFTMSSNLPSDAFQPISASQVQRAITPALFAEAIKDLPLDTLYAKAAELQNSISHLLSSNIQMKPFADDGDRDCAEAIEENDAVIKRNEERIGLLKTEAENRGMSWSSHGDNTEEVPKTNGHVEGEGMATASSGRLTDEELRRQLEAQMRDTAEDDDGVHL